MLARLGRLSNWLGFNRASSRKPEEDDLDLSWLYPPDNPEDVAGWDRHWAEQVAHGLGPQIFDLFCDDRKFVTMMNEQGMRRILCAGNGISQEPQALAAAGFDVVALDISPQATEIARSLAPIPERLRHYIDDSMRRPGGHVDFVVGDIRDSAICRGPFDLIIERCTAQLYANRGLDTLLNNWQSGCIPMEFSSVTATTVPGDLPPNRVTPLGHGLNRMDGPYGIAVPQASLRVEWPASLVQPGRARIGQLHMAALTVFVSTLREGAHLIFAGVLQIR